MPGPYSIVLSCLAIDILLSAGSSDEDAGHRDTREVVKTPQSDSPAPDRNINHLSIPEDLIDYLCWIPDSGYCLYTIPECDLDTAEKSGTLSKYVVRVPAPYVIEKGYRFYEGFLVCDVPYDDRIGADIPEEYYRWF